MSVYSGFIGNTAKKPVLKKCQQGCEHFSRVMFDLKKIMYCCKKRQDNQYKCKLFFPLPGKEQGTDTEKKKNIENLDKKGQEAQTEITVS